MKIMNMLKKFSAKIAAFAGGTGFMLKKFSAKIAAFAGGTGLMLASTASNADIGADITAAVAAGKANLELASSGLITIVAVLVAFTLIYNLLKR